MASRIQYQCFATQAGREIARDLVMLGLVPGVEYWVGYGPSYGWKAEDGVTHDRVKGEGVPIPGTDLKFRCVRRSINYSAYGGNGAGPSLRAHIEGDKKEVLAVHKRALKEAYRQLDNLKSDGWEIYAPWRVSNANGERRKISVSL